MKDNSNRLYYLGSPLGPVMKNCKASVVCGARRKTSKLNGNTETATRNQNHRQCSIWTDVKKDCLNRTFFAQKLRAALIN